MVTTSTSGNGRSSEAPRLRNFIGGEWGASTASSELPVHDPGTGALLGRVPLSSASDANAAVEAASVAYPGWRATPIVERARVLFRLKHLLEDNLEEIAVMVTREHGKTLPDARGEVRRGIENVEHACGIPSLMMGKTLEDIATGIDCETVRQPLGVFAAFTPYNFPVMVPMWFWPYAIATGNTFVLKPSEQDPIAHQRIVELAAEAGLPPGVLNVVHGDRTAVEAIIDHPEMKGVSFVGSSTVAKAVYARAGERGIRVQGLGGAKNHMVVMPDADFDVVIDGLLGSLFHGAGQRCLAGSVVVGVDSAYVPLRERLLSGAASMKVGYGLDEGVEMGPLVSAPHRDRVAGFIEEGASDGAGLLLDGRGKTVDGYPDGHWLGPTIFDGVSPEMSIGREEIFGPVASLTRCESLDDAVELMHRNSYGNATSIFTTSGRAAREFRYAAGISMIGVNIGVAAPMAFFPFGGSRGSFYGDLKAQGKDAIEFYTDQRVVITRW